MHSRCTSTRVCKGMVFLGWLPKRRDIEDGQIGMLQLEALFSIRERAVPDRQQLLLIQK